MINSRITEAVNPAGSGCEYADHILIVQLKLPRRILRPGSIYLRHLGEMSLRHSLALPARASVRLCAVQVSGTEGVLAVLLPPTRAKSDTILSGDKTKPRRKAGLTFQTRANFKADYMVGTAIPS